MSRSKLNLGKSLRVKDSKRPKSETPLPLLREIKPKEAIQLLRSLEKL